MEELETYPELFIHGISSINDIENEVPTAECLSRFKANAERQDSDYNELSINWFDCENALNHILEQRNSDGEYQFKCGVTIFITSELEILSKKPQVRNILKYERDRLPNNEYHGNLLLSKKARRQDKYMVACGLSLNCFKEFKPRNLKNPDQ